MPASDLLEIAQSGSYDAFESRCLELLEDKGISLKQLVAPFERLARSGQRAQLAALALTVFATADLTSDPKAALELARIALIAEPGNEQLRRMTVDLYREVYGHFVRFDVVLAASGLEGGRPVRMALNLLDLCLTLQPGDTLISRMDDRVVEVAEIDRENGLFTLRDTGRTVTRPAPDVVREFERVASDDFRVMRQLRPEQLAKLITEDPVAVVIGLIHAHGEHIDTDLLQHELVPRHVASKDWSRWWTRAKAALKRSPHVVMEGRSPVILSYCAEGQSLEDETWETFEAARDPAGWLGTVEGYLREKATRKEKPDESLLQRVHDYLFENVKRAEGRRPGEALACALMIESLSERGLPATDEGKSLAVYMLRDAKSPDRMLAGVHHDGLRAHGLAALQAARPDDWVRFATALLPTAPAALLDRVAREAVAAGHGDAVQSFLDAGLNDLASHPELVYWLWKGPSAAKQLNLPEPDELFHMILDSLNTLGRTVTAEAHVVRTFRQRAKSALALRGYAKARQCLERMSEAAAITTRRALERLEGLGYTTQAKLLDMLRDAHPQLWVVKPKRVEPWADPETLWATAEGIQKRTAERDEIVNIKMRENAQRIGEAASHGDLSENAEYKFALEERDLLRARLAGINDELVKARALEPEDVPTDRVSVGSKVTLRNWTQGGERTMTFFGPFDTDVERGIYGYQAPVAQRLMGCRVGDRVTITLDGQDVEFEVTGLANAVPGAGT